MLYDVLNQIGLEGRLAGSTVAETELAHAHLAAVQPGDVLLNVGVTRAIVGWSRCGRRGRIG